MKKICFFLSAMLLLCFIPATADFDNPLVDPGSPGIQIAIESGLTTDLNLTAEPALPESLSGSENPDFREIALVDGTVVHDSTSVTLKWVYKEIGRIIISAEAKNLPEGMTFGMPVFSYDRVYTYDDIVMPENKTMRVDGNHLLAIAYEVGNPKNNDRKIDIGIDIPIMKQDNLSAEAAATFHFELKDYIMPMGQGISWQQTGSVIKNGFEVQLRQIRFLEQQTHALVCYDSLAEAENWQPDGAALLQEGNRIAKIDSVMSLPDPAGLKDRCEWLAFPITAFDQNAMLTLLIDRFKSAADPNLQSAEEFDFYITIPTEPIFPEHSQTTAFDETPPYDPAAVRMTLDWGYADATRLTLGYHITGLPYTPEATFLSGDIRIRNADGDEIRPEGMGRNIWSNPENGVITGIYDLRVDWMPVPLGNPPYQLSFILGGSGESGSPDMIPFGVFEPAHSLSAGSIQIPDKMIGAFNFEVDLPVYPFEKPELNLESTANGIRMRLLRAEITPVSSSLYLCYQKPSDHDWMVGGSESGMPFFEVGGVRLSSYQYMLLYDEFFGGWMPRAASSELSDLAVEPDERCIKLSFGIGKTADPQTFKLMIPRLMQSRPEVVPAEKVEAIREPLKALGIEFNYSTFNSGSGGGGGFQILTMLDGMTEMEALEQIDHALGYFHHGPWSFEFELP